MVRLVGSRGEQRLEVGEHGVDVSEDLLVGEADHTVAPSFEQRRAFGVACGLGRVDGAIKLNHQAPLGDAEVGDKRPDRVLPTHLHPKPPTAQVMP
jgi:hypothetical protein